MGRPKKNLQRQNAQTWRRSKLRKKTRQQKHPWKCLKSLASVTSVDIQITVNNILLENKRISGEVMELKSTVYKQKAELSAIKESLVLTTKQCANTEKNWPSEIN